MTCIYSPSKVHEPQLKNPYFIKPSGFGDVCVVNVPVVGPFNVLNTALDAVVCSFPFFFFLAGSLQVLQFVVT